MIGQSSSQLSPSSKNTNNKNGRSDENGTDNGNGNGNGNGLHLLPDSSASASASSSSRSRPTSPHPHNLQRLMSESDTEMIIPRTPRPKALTPSPPRTRMGTPDGELDSMVLLRTLDFAARKHSCQRRKDLDMTPYINHPIAVANFLSSTGITDVRVLQAAILHDTVEDTCTTIEELADVFGTDVARIVEECTDNTEYTALQRKAEQLRTAPFKSREAQQVKLADKLHNLESIRRSPPVGWGIKRIQAYFIWAKQVTDICGPAHPPLAARLQHLYETAHTRVNGIYYPCHPEVGGPMTEEEKASIDSRLVALKAGETMHPNPIFF